MAGLRKPFRGTYPMTQGFGHVGNPVEPVGWRRNSGGPWQASYLRQTAAGWRRFADLHFGTDWDMPKGTPILAMERGKVVETGYTSGRGKYIVVRIAGTTTRYRVQHLSRIGVTTGQQVTRGQQLGLSGASGAVVAGGGRVAAGDVPGSHLHVEVWRGTQGAGIRYDAQRLMVGGDHEDAPWIKPV